MTLETRTLRVMHFTTRSGDVLRSAKDALQLVQAAIHFATAHNVILRRVPCIPLHGDDILALWGVGVRREGPELERAVRPREPRGTKRRQSSADHLRRFAAAGPGRSKLLPLNR